jgi:hypothetical protein
MMRPLPEPEEDECEWLPTPEEIAEECRRIRATWDDATRQMRDRQWGGGKARASGGRRVHVHCTEPEAPDQVPTLET